jgi:thiol-disulfide isomerase/thioredoxin
VVEVTTDSWVREVSQDVAAYGVVFALFLKKGSPPCKAVFPDFQEAANKSVGLVKFVSIDAAAHPKLAHLQTVRAVPAFRIIHHKGAKEYKGDTSSDSLVEAASRLIPNHAKSADASWVPSPTAPLSAILFTTKKVVPAFWSRISCVFKGNSTIRIGYSKSLSIQGLFGVNGPISIVFIFKDITSVYEGQLAFGPVYEALLKFCENPKASGTEVALITELSDAGDFEQLCHNTGRFCVFAGMGIDMDGFENIAKMNRNGPFRFMRCGSECPFAGMPGRLYVFHAKRETGIVVDDLGGLGAVLDRVVDGGAQWRKFVELFGRDEI